MYIAIILFHTYTPNKHTHYTINLQKKQVLTKKEEDSSYIFLPIQVTITAPPVLDGFVPTNLDVIAEDSPE